MVYVFSTCTELIRTLPALQHDQTKAEDVDTDGEDHAPDALRYLCMARPWTQNRPIATEPEKIGYKLDDLWKDREIHMSRARRRV